MNSFLLKSKLSNIQKICISGLFIALLMILNKVIAINNIPVIPFVRLSIGAGALAIIASFVLGPLYGMVVVGMADVLGYLIFDPKTFGFFPTITLIYILLGVVPYFLFCFVNQFKNKKTMKLIEYTVFLVLLGLLSLFFTFNNQISLFGSVYSFNLTQKILIISGLFIVLFFNVLINLIIDKKVKNENLIFNIYQVSFVSFLTELIVFVLFGSLMKSIAFGFEMFFPILISQIIISFINVPINTYLILLVLRVTKRFII